MHQRFDRRSTRLNFWMNQRNESLPTKKSDVDLQVNMIPVTKEANRLLLDGSLALARMEANGIRVDEAYLDRAIEKTGGRIKQLEDKLRADPIWTEWRKVHGERSKIGSREQLGKVLFDHMRIPSPGVTAKSQKEGAKWRHRTDEGALEEIDLPFVRRFVRVERLKKARSTYLIGLKREVVGGFVHPSGNLHTVSTYRSSFKEPNIQNQPIRNPEIGRIVRRCYIPREGHALVEIDFTALEFKIASCFWKDPEMVKYASNDSLDIHRDMAALIFKCKKIQVTKKMRYYGKNGFVFPHLYGSYWGKIAPIVWGEVQDLEMEDGVSVRDHLKSREIISQQNFEQHVKKIEEKFDRRFHVFANGRDKWYDDYRKVGAFPFLTGFRSVGLYSKNEVLNAPIQGPAFHCLLWSAIEIQREIDRRKMGALPVAEIHDSLLADVPIREIEDYVSLCSEVMMERVRKHWSWIIVPLKVEVETCRRNWHEKEPWTG